MSKQIIPAVFFQKRSSGPVATRNRPERLELFEKDLVAVTGGLLARGMMASAAGDTCCRDRCGCWVVDDCGQ